MTADSKRGKPGRSLQGKGGGNGRSTTTSTTTTTAMAVPTLPTPKPKPKPTPAPAPACVTFTASQRCPSSYCGWTGSTCQATFNLAVASDGIYGASTNVCPAGLTVVSQLATCQASLFALSAVWGWEGSWSDTPQYCYLNPIDNRVFFNNHPTGGPSSSGRARTSICFKAPITTTTTTTTTTTSTTAQCSSFATHGRCPYPRCYWSDLGCEACADVSGTYHMGSQHSPLDIVKVNQTGCTADASGSSGVMTWIIEGHVVDVQGSVRGNEVIGKVQRNGNILFSGIEAAMAYKQQEATPQPTDATPTAEATPQPTDATPTAAHSTVIVVQDAAEGEQSSDHLLPILAVTVSLTFACFLVCILCLLYRLYVKTRRQSATIKECISVTPDRSSVAQQKYLQSQTTKTITEDDNRYPPWDFFISHTQRNLAAVSLAVDIYYSMLRKGFKVWLDVKMEDRSTVGMEHGVRNSTVVLAILTGSSEQVVGYFSRPLCCQELRWAYEFQSFIQPIVLSSDKPFISEIMAEAPSDLMFLSSVDFIDVNRLDPEYFEVGLDKLVRVLTNTPRKDRQTVAKPCATITTKTITVETTTSLARGDSLDFISPGTPSLTNADIATQIGKSGAFDMADAAPVVPSEPNFVQNTGESSNLLT